MKKLKFLSLTLLFTMIFSFGVYAEETTADASENLNTQETTETSETEILETDSELSDNIDIDENNTTTQTNQGQIEKHKDKFKEIMDTIGLTSLHVVGRPPFGYYPFTSFGVRFPDKNYIGKDSRYLGRFDISNAFQDVYTTIDPSTLNFTEEKKELLIKYLIELENECFEYCSKEEYPEFHSGYDILKGKNFYSAVMLNLFAENLYFKLEFKDNSAMISSNFMGNPQYIVKDYEKALNMLGKIAREVYAHTVTFDEYRYEVFKKFNALEFTDTGVGSHKHIDSISFDVTLDDSYYLTLAETLAGNNKKLNVTIDLYYDSGHSYYILTLKGKNGTKRFYNGEQHSSGTFSGAGYRNFLIFPLNYQIIDNIQYDIEGKYTTDIIIINGSSTDGKGITEATFYYSPIGNNGSSALEPFDGKLHDNRGFFIPPNPVKATENIEYKVYGEIKNIANGISMGRRFGIPDGVITTDKFTKDGEITGDMYYEVPKPVDEIEKEPGGEMTEEEYEKLIAEQAKQEEKKEVKESFTEEAEKLTKLEVLKGTDKGLELEKSFTRAEGAVMLTRLLGKEAEAEEYGKLLSGKFTDTKGHWAEAFISYCFENGIIKGTSETEFSPQRAMTGEEYLTLILRALGYKEAEPEKATEIAETAKISNKAQLDIILKGEFTREKMAYISLEALKASDTDGTALIDSLIKSGAITKEQAESIK